ncbi:dipeptide epimerase [Phycisphaera mikurensis]|nr:dipeptide epimerase [Phycisphaera mikurensis]MBB6443294.1 L-alanine-DL-glutamate epimerase-like enolase superfamily enzyme [Phycisphaera mikurensis]
MRLAPVSWPLVRPFRIARAEYRTVEALRLELHDGRGNRGRSEALGDDYHGESVASMRRQLEDSRARVEAGIQRVPLIEDFPRGGARHLLDAALWDLEAKRSGVPAWRAAGIGEPRRRVTAFTVGLGDGEELAAELRRVAGFPLLKLKVGGDDPRPLIERVRRTHPDAELILDANAAWSIAQLRSWLPALPGLGVSLLEQPLPPGEDEALADLDHAVPIAADESVDDTATLPPLIGRYDAVNIKLDKAGGLTEALRLADAAGAAGLAVMVGCMGGSSLAMAPAAVLAQRARWIDLDGPLLQREDVSPPIRYEAGWMGFPEPELWG